MTSESPAPVADPIEDAVLRRIPFEIAALSVVLAAGAGFIFDFPTAALFFGGGLLAAVSFLWMKSALAKVLARDKKGALRAGVALYAVRCVLILGVFLLIILAYPNRILAFAAGFSTVIPVFIIEAAVALAHMKTWKA
jgi:hypothetical protein